MAQYTEPSELLATWFSYDPETGIVSWKKKSARNTMIGDPAGCKIKDDRNTYLRIIVRGQKIYAHIIAFVAIHGRKPNGVIDHIDGDGTNNRASNIREVSHADNGRNIRRNIRNTAGVMGVDFDAPRNKWRARIVFNLKQISLGTFGTREEAIAARKAAEADLGFHPNHGRE